MQDTFEHGFKEHLQGLYQQATPRQRAWEHFVNKGLPSKQHPSYRFVRLRDLYESRYCLGKTPVAEISAETHTYPECQNAKVVFVNGIFQENLSTLAGLPKGIVLLPLSKAQKQFAPFFNHKLVKELQEEKDAFALLNGSLWNEGAFLYIPPKLKCESPIQIVHLTDEKLPLALLTPRLYVFVGQEASLNLYSTMVSREVFWNNSFIDFTIDERGHLSYFPVVSLPENAWYFEALRATLKKHSRFETIGATNGAKTHHQDFSIAFKGEEGDARVYQAWTLEQKRQAHFNVLMDHQEPHCHSLQKFKGILADLGRSSFDGKIYVHPKAQKTQAYQMNNHLLLSEHATAISQPNLEILADDVKASHGSTVGQLQQEELFYLKSRGLTEESARKLLIQGFSREILDQIPLPSARDLASNIAQISS